MLAGALLHALGGLLDALGGLLDLRLEGDFELVLGDFVGGLADVHAQGHAALAEEAAEAANGAVVGVVGGEADAEVAAKGAHGHLEAARGGHDVDVAHVGGQALVEADDAQVGDGGGGVARGHAVGDAQHEVLEQERGKAQERVLLEGDHAVHAVLEVLGLRGGLELLLHALGNPLHGRGGALAGHVAHERQAKKVARGGRVEELPQVNRHVDADGARTLAAGHVGRDAVHEHGDHKRCEAHAPGAREVEHGSHGHVELEERGVGGVAPAHDAVGARQGVARGLAALVVFVEGVLGLLGGGAGRLGRGAFDAVALDQVVAQELLKETQAAAAVAHDVRDLEVDARAVVAHAEKGAARAGVQTVADGHVLGCDRRHLRELLQVVPKEAVAQADVERGERRYRLGERTLQGRRVHGVDQRGRIAEHGLLAAARLGGVELANVV